MMKDKYKILIISSWIVLIICFAIKLFGGNWFEVMVENQNFINACNWLDSNLIALYSISTLTYCASMYLIYLSLTKQKIKSDLWILLVMLPGSILKGFVPILGLIIDISIWFLIPLIKYKFKNWKRVIIGNILIVAFQLISLFIRNIGWNLDNQSSLLSLIMMIDYYIMIILYYLYTNREERSKWEFGVDTSSEKKMKSM